MTVICVPYSVFGAALSASELAVGVVSYERPLGPFGFDFAQHRPTLRPSVDGIRSKALRPFGLQ